MIELILRPSIIAGNHDLTFHNGWYQQHYRNWHRDMEVSLSLITDPPAGRRYSASFRMSRGSKPCSPTLALGKLTSAI